MFGSFKIDAELTKTLTVLHPDHMEGMAVCQVSGKDNKCLAQSIAVHIFKNADKHGLSKTSRSPRSLQIPISPLL